MNRFKLTVSLVSLCCVFLLACATQVSAATSTIMISSVSPQPTLQQAIIDKLRRNPNLNLTQLQVHIDGNKIALYGQAATGFERALAQKFLENTQGIAIIENKMQVRN
ncbi:BON domain-containing protein [Pseudoalteromonas haloplanktis]|uniref:BON domain-containing protein n=1 Tax=Pseudoalteromonas haloplanktis TaxID=228 RepID=A0ABU1BGY5_PSEHA|nr:BON domain-containing protein [Pseudoalteromonas haloplanktis]MDQ9093016.1 BON domain-containing protein [Pseudoalteromonas haloplanktis]